MTRHKHSGFSLLETIAAAIILMVVASAAIVTLAPGDEQRQATPVDQPPPQR